MYIKTYEALGVMYAMLKMKGKQGGFIARGKTAREAIDNVLFTAMNSKII